MKFVIKTDELIRKWRSISLEKVEENKFSFKGKIKEMGVLDIGWMFDRQGTIHKRSQYRGIENGYEP